jgi:NHL repeat
MYFVGPNIYPDQVWAMRRYLPVVIPGLLVSAGYLLHLLWRQRNADPVHRAGGYVAIGLTALLVAWPAVVTHPMWAVRTGVPQLAQVEAVCDRIGDDAAVVALGTSAIGSYTQTMRSFCEVPSQAMADPSPAQLAEVRANVEATGRTLYVISEEAQFVPYEPGQPADPGSFYQPNDVITYPNGDILVAEGHGNAPPATARLVRFDKSGKFLREFGKMGSGTDGEFMQPHGLAFDSRGRLFVADRSNNRIQILDAESFKTLDTWYQFSRLSGIFIDKNDMVYGADSESGSVNPPHGAWKRGMRIGSAKDGKVLYFIEDPSSVGETFSMVDGKPVTKKADGSAGATGTLAAEGVAVDAAGNIYGAEVGPRKVQKYVKK